MSYTANPLSDTQAEQLVQILAANPMVRPARAAGATSDAAPNQTATRTMVFTTGVSGGGADRVVASTGPMGVMGLGGTQISDTAVAAARPILNDPQYEALQQMQQQQTQMRSMMQSVGGGQPGQPQMGFIRVESTTATSSSGTPPPPPTTGTKPPGGE